MGGFKSVISRTRGWMAGIVILSSGSAMAQKFDFYYPDIVDREVPTVTTQIRTNLLLDAALCPNVGVEIQTKKGLAWQLDFGEAWWNSFSRNKFYSFIHFYTEIRKYLGSRAVGMPYRGHHVGVYMQMAAYDFENGGKGYISPELDDNIVIGVSYGYSFRLGKRLSLDCTVGVGYFGYRYEGYLPVGDRYVSTGENKKTWVGPTKVEASLVWNVTKKNRR